MVRENFLNVTHCAMFFIRNNPDWTNAKIAEEVSSAMGSNTNSKCISWYKGQIKKGKLDANKFLSALSNEQASEQKIEEAVVEPAPTIEETIEVVSEIKMEKDSFPTVAHCAIYMLDKHVDWTNQKIAEEVSRIMGSRTANSNISWYKGKLKKGDFNKESYLKDVGKKKSAKPENAEFEIPKELQVTEDDLLHSKGIQKMALRFFRERTEKSFNELYLRLKPGMINHAMKLMNNNEELAADVVAMAFVKIWTKIDQYNKYWNFSTWAYRIVFNEAMQTLRKEKMGVGIDSNNMNDERGFYELSLIKQGAEEELLSVSPDWAIDENKDDFQQEVFEKVMEDMHNLPTMYKEIMIDRELNGMKYQQIADKRGIKINSVKTQIKRARTKIIENNQEYYKIVQEKNKKRKEKSAS